MAGAVNEVVRVTIVLAEERAKARVQAVVVVGAGSCRAKVVMVETAMDVSVGTPSKVTLSEVTPSEVTLSEVTPSKVTPQCNSVSRTLNYHLQVT